MLEPKNGDYVKYIEAIEADTLRRLRQSGLKALDEASLGVGRAMPSGSVSDVLTGGDVAESLPPLPREEKPRIFRGRRVPSPSAQHAPQSTSQPTGLDSTAWGKTADVSVGRSEGSLLDMFKKGNASRVEPVTPATPVPNSSQSRRASQLQDKLQFGGVALAGIGIFVSLALLNSGYTVEELFPFPGILVIAGITMIFQGSKVKKR